MSRGYGTCSTKFPMKSKEVLLYGLQRVEVTYNDAQSAAWTLTPSFLQNSFVTGTFFCGTVLKIVCTAHRLAIWMSWSTGLLLPSLQLVTTILEDMLWRTWKEVEYQLDIVCATKVLTWGSSSIITNFGICSSLCNKQSCYLILYRFYRGSTL